jgi:hypothetical protein
MPSNDITPYIPPSNTPNETQLINQVVQLLLSQSIDTSLLHHNVTNLDLIPIDGISDDFIAIKLGLAHRLWFTLQHFARVILCAANDYKPSELAGLPLLIPAQVLEQISLPFPNIIYTESCTDSNPLIYVQHQKFQEVVIHMLQWAGLSAIEWIAITIERSNILGEESLWKWDGLLRLLGRTVDSENFKDQIERELDEANTLALTSEIFGSTNNGNYLQDLVFHPVTGRAITHEATSIGELRNFLEATNGTVSLATLHMESLTLDRSKRPLTTMPTSATSLITSTLLTSMTMY